MFFYWFCWVLVWLPLQILFPTRIIGKKNLPKKKKAILACNHLSNSDIVVINNNMPRRPYVLAKIELFKNKLVGAILKSYGGIPVNRQEVGLSTIKTVLKYLKEEQWILVFPEGTRNKLSEDDMLAMKNGTALFALKSGAPVVPMWIFKRPRIFRCNKILIGEPVDLSKFEGQKTTKENLEQVSKIISEQMYKLRDDYLQAQSLKKKKDKKAK